MKRGARANVVARWVVMIVMAFVAPIASAEQTLIEAHDEARVERIEPSGTKWHGSHTSWEYDWRKTGKPGIVTGDQILSSGYGWGYGPGTGAALRCTFTGQRSVSVLFVFHLQGQTAKVLLNGELRRRVNTHAPSSFQFNAKGISGQVREVLVADDLDPAETYTLEIRNTGTIDPGAEYREKFTTNNPKTDRSRGPQLVVDAIRLSTERVGELTGTVRDANGQPCPGVRITLDTDTGPILDEHGRTVAYTDGFGRYSLAGLPRDTELALQAYQRRLIDQTTVVTIPEDGRLVHDVVADPGIVTLHPRLGTPAFVQPGETFRVQVIGDPGVGDWTAELRNTFKAIPLEIRSIERGTIESEYATRPGWMLGLRVPEETPPELWDLHVVSDAGIAREPRAVRVRADDDEPILIAHLSDNHTGQLSDALFAQALRAIDVVGADYLAITGDLTAPTAQHQIFEQAHRVIREHLLDTPVVIIPGNHELTPTESYEWTRQVWERVFGLPRFAFRVEPVFTLAHDCMSRDTVWAEAEFAASLSEPDVSVRVILDHDASLRRATDLRPDIMLIGDGHENRVDITEHGYPQVMTTFIHNPVQGRVVRFERQGNGDWVLGPEYKQVLILATGESEGDLKLVRTFDRPNDGTMDANAAIIDNQTPQRFERAQARMVLRAGDYAVTAGPGWIVNQYRSDDGRFAVVRLSIDAAPGRATRVEVDQR